MKLATMSFVTGFGAIWIFEVQRFLRSDEKHKKGAKRSSIIIIVIVIIKTNTITPILS